MNDEQSQTNDDSVTRAETDASGETVAPVMVPLPQLLEMIQGGHGAMVRPILEQLLQQNPEDAGILHAVALLAATERDYERAEKLFRRVTERNPKMAEAWSNLGNVLYLGKRVAEAIEAYRTAIALQPGLADAHSNLARALIDLGEMAEAEKCLQRALMFQPTHAEAHANLAHLLERQGRLEEAIRHLRQALVWKPQLHGVENTLLSLLYRVGALREAEGLAKRLLEQRPEDIETLRACAVGLMHQGEYDAARRHFEKILAIAPEQWENHMALGSLLQLSGDYAAARAAFQRAIQFREADSGACIGALAGLALDQGLLSEAREALQQAIGLNPRHVPLLANLGSTLVKSGDIAWGIEVLRQAVELAPQVPELHSMLIFNLHYDPEATPETRWEVIRQWGERHGLPHGGKPAERPPLLPKSPGEPLRVGLVSADFREHTIARCIEPLLRGVDPTRIEFTAYSVSPKADATTQRLKALVPHWRACAGLGVLDLAQRIRQDMIDILIDLGVHSGGHRLKTFVERPAPIQISWLGLYCSTGLDCMDYRLTDRWMDPPGQTERWHSEALAYLPTVCPAAMAEDLPEPGALPADERGFITFAGATALPRMNDLVLDAWAEILLALPQARLRMFTRVNAEDRASLDRLLSRMRLRDIDPERVDVVPRLSYAEFMAALAECDIALDSFPYGGGLTSIDCMWMGLPVVTRVGESSFERTGFSLLAQVDGLELAAGTIEDYCRIAIELASDLPRLRMWRGCLRERLAASPVIDASRFARGFEETMQQIWQAACAGRFGKLEALAPRSEGA